MGYFIAGAFVGAVVTFLVLAILAVASKNK